MFAFLPFAVVSVCITAIACVLIIVAQKNERTFVVLNHISEIIEALVNLADEREAKIKEEASNEKKKNDTNSENHKVDYESRWRKERKNVLFR